MDIASKSQFLNKECTIYNLTLNELEIYLLLINVNEANSQKITIFFNEKIDSALTFTPKNDNFLFTSLNEIELEQSEKNREIINAFCKEDCDNKYAYLALINGEVIITFDLNILEENEAVSVLGVFLIDKDSLVSLLSNADEEVILKDFKEEDKLKGQVSSIFFEEEIPKVEDGEEEGKSFSILFYEIFYEIF